MNTSTFSLENELADQGYGFVIGVDEAGRGPLAGPVVASAVLLRNFEFRISNFEANNNDQIFNDKMWELIRDSKKLSARQREKAHDFIFENFHVGIGLCDHGTIDRINILEASFLAMKKAVADLVRNVEREYFINVIPSKAGIQETLQKPGFRLGGRNDKVIILVDGNKDIPNFSMRQKAIINGDGLVKSISAASIVAKVTRDRMMLEMHKKYPQYCFDRHKGYGTRAHMEALIKYGPCEIHRRSFAPVRASQN